MISRHLTSNLTRTRSRPSSHVQLAINLCFAGTLFLSVLLVFSILGLWDSLPMALTLAAMQFFLGMGVVHRRYLEYGLGDPLLLFTMMFLVYNTGALTELALKAWRGESIFLIARAYSSSELVKAGTCSLLAVLGLSLVTLLLPSPHHRRQAEASRVRIPVARLFWLSIGGISVYLVTYSAIVITTVGVQAFLGASRAGASRINPSTVLGFGIPLPALATASCAGMFCSLCLEPTRRRQLITGAVALVFILFNFVQGSRHLVAYLLFIALGAYTTIGAKRSIPFKLLVVLGGLSYCLFGVIANFRSDLIAYWAGQVTLTNLVEAIQHLSWTWFLPTRNEFGGGYFTLLETVADSSPLLLGQTYVKGIANILPTRLYPGTKPPDLGYSFAIAMGWQYSWLGGVGFGFSPVAEAYVNFGMGGIPVVFAIFGWVLHRIGQLRYDGLTRALIYLVLLTQIVNANRYSIDGVMQEALYSMIFAVILTILTKGVRSRGVATYDSTD